MEPLDVRVMIGSLRKASYNRKVFDNSHDDIVQAIAAAGAEVDAVREIRPSFEEVFGVLIERDRAAAAQRSAAADGGGPGDDAGTTPSAGAQPAATEAA